MKKLWKRIVGHENYEISNYGEVRSYICSNGLRKEPKIIKTYPTTRIPYRQVKLTKGKMGSVHRLVAEAFVKRIEGKNHVGHINGDPSDNRCINLKWVTPKENSADRVVHKTLAKGERNGKSKLTSIEAKNIKSEWLNGQSQVSLAKKYGVATGTIWCVVHDRTWSSEEEAY